MRHMASPLALVALMFAATTVVPPAGAAISTTIIDRQTGRPAAGACVWVIPAGTFTPPERGSGRFCSDDRGALRAGPLAAGRYTLFALPAEEGRLGAQWVGRKGGTGDQRMARVVSVKAGAVATIDPIGLDLAGSVTGLVTSAAGGDPVREGSVGLVAPQPGRAGEVVQVSFGPLDSGRYTLRGLGPYEWPLHFTAVGHPAQWSGGTSNRYLADTVKIISRMEITRDVALRQGRELNGLVRTVSGARVGRGFVIVRDATTGDPAGYAAIGARGEYRIATLGPWFVKIEYRIPGAASDASGRRVDVSGWYGGATEARATVVMISANQDKTVEITIR